MRFGNTLITIVLAFCFSPLLAQQISIVNKQTGHPVSDVFIYNEDKSKFTYSDQKGMVSLSSFAYGNIYIQHPSFHSISFLYEGRDIDIELKEKLISYSEIVVSANKWKQDETMTHQHILPISKKAIQFQNSQTSADVLKGTGQVFVQKSQMGGGSPKIRGFAANAVLLVVDGVRMNNAIFRSGNLQNIINIDPNALSSAEVVFGPGSVIYGSDALGGVMNFQTITPQWSSDSLADFSGNALVRYSSASNERTSHVDFSLSKERFTLFHSTSFSAFDDLMAGSKRIGDYRGAFERKHVVKREDGQDLLVRNKNINLQAFSGYNLFNTTTKATFRIGANADFSYGFYYSTTSDIPRYDNLTETKTNSDSLKHAEWYYGPQEWLMHNLRLNTYNRNLLFDQAQITVAYQHFHESRNDRAFGDSRLRVRNEKLAMYSISTDFDKVIQNSNLYYGLDFYYNNVASSALRRNIDTGEISVAQSRYPDGGSTYLSMAAYSTLTSPLGKKTTLNTGLRINSVHLNAKTKNERTFEETNRISLRNGAVNGTAGIVHTVNQKSKLSYHVSTGFRAPNLDDIGKVFEVGNRITIPNPDLKPEYTLSNEVSIQHRTDHFFFRVTGFYSRLFQAIVEGPYSLNGASEAVFDGDTLTISSKLNTGEAYIYGGSAVITANFAKHWAVSKTINLTEGRDLANNQPLRHTTPIFGQVSLTYKKNSLRSILSFDYNGRKDRDQIPSSEIEDKPYLYTKNGSPGWYTLGFRTAYTVSDMFSFNMGLENILNLHYRPYTSGISASGRNFSLSIRASI